MRYALPVVGLVLAATLFVGCDGRDGGSQNSGNNVKAETSPWDSLSAQEIQATAAAVIQRHGGGVLFNRISLAQPDKTVALQWRPGQQAARQAAVSFRADGKTHHVIYDLNVASLAPTQTLSLIHI